MPRSDLHYAAAERNERWQGVQGAAPPAGGLPELGGKEDRLRYPGSGTARYEKQLGNLELVPTQLG